MKKTYKLQVVLDVEIEINTSENLEEISDEKLENIALGNYFNSKSMGFIVDVGSYKLIEVGRKIKK